MTLLRLHWRAAPLVLTGSLLLLRKHWRAVLMMPAAGLLFYSLWLWTMWHKGYESAQYLIAEEGDYAEYKKILLYTPLDGSYDSWKRRFPGPLLTCRAQDLSYTCSSAVLVSLTDINRFPWTWLPTRMGALNKNQKWVAYWGEAPSFFHQTTTFESASDFRSLNNLFTWTASYRRDADFRSNYLAKDELDYCTWQPKTTTDDNKLQVEDLISKKSELVLWVVSHCPTSSRREKFVGELQAFIPVTVVGECSELGADQRAFSQMAWHKFYLSFENSLCDDYITEKLHNVLQNYNTVPVVMGPKKEDYLKVAPPNSFIHVADFASIADLANYLVYLNTNTTAYFKYLEWKNNYELVCAESWSCKLCKALYSETELHKSGTISDFVHFWQESKCYSSWNHSASSPKR